MAMRRGRAAAVLILLVACAATAAANCADAPDVENGDASRCAGSSTGANCNVVCATGYESLGTSLTTCNADGTWSPVSCVDKDGCKDNTACDDVRSTCVDVPASEEQRTGETFMCKCRPNYAGKAGKTGGGCAKNGISLLEGGSLELSAAGGLDIKFVRGESTVSVKQLLANLDGLDAPGTGTVAVNAQAASQLVVRSRDVLSDAEDLTADLAALKTAIATQAGTLASERTRLSDSEAALVEKREALDSLADDLESLQSDLEETLPSLLAKLDEADELLDTGAGEAADRAELTQQLNDLTLMATDVALYYSDTLDDHSALLLDIRKLLNDEIADEVSRAKAAEESLRDELDVVSDALDDLKEVVAVDESAYIADEDLYDYFECEQHHIAFNSNPFYQFDAKTKKCISKYDTPVGFSATLASRVYSSGNRNWFTLTSWTIPTNGFNDKDSNFATSSGIFTAPKDGTYVVAASPVFSSVSGSLMEAAVVVNNVNTVPTNNHYQRIYAERSDGYYSLSLFGPLVLKANDKVTLQVKSSDSGFYLEKSSTFSMFIIDEEEVESVNMRLASTTYIGPGGYLDPMTTSVDNSIYHVSDAAASGLDTTNGRYTARTDNGIYLYRATTYHGSNPLNHFYIYPRVNGANVYGEAYYWTGSSSYSYLDWSSATTVGGIKLTTSQYLHFYCYNRRYSSTYYNTEAHSSISVVKLPSAFKEYSARVRLNSMSVTSNSGSISLYTLQTAHPWHTNEGKVEGDVSSRAIRVSADGYYVCTYSFKVYAHTCGYAYAELRINDVAAPEQPGYAASGYYYGYSYNYFTLSNTAIIKAKANDAISVFPESNCDGSWTVQTYGSFSCHMVYPA